MAGMFFDTWAGVARTLVVGSLAYAGLVILLRWSGKRTLSKMNAFDFIVTVAIGSTLATVLLSKTVPLAEGLLALMLLIGLQFVVTWSSVRIGLVRRLVTGEPQLLLDHGRLLPVALRRARVTEGEVRAAVREAGVCDLAVVTAVVLETDGSLSVLRRGEGEGLSSLADVRRPDTADSANA